MKNWLLILCLFPSFLLAQSIVQSASVSPLSIPLGGMIQSNILLNQCTFSDSQIPRTDINHATKTIDFIIDYNFISSGTPSTQTIPVTHQAQLLLEGVYTVTLRVNVPADGTKGETRVLSTVTVTAPTMIPCGTTSFITSFCPLLGNQVCAEDGKVYGNECIAYFDNQNSVYSFGDCFAQSSIRTMPFACNQVYSSGTNFFTKYDCNNKCLDAGEIFLTYQKDTPDDVTLNYTATPNTVVMLVELNNDGITCLSESDDGSLSLNNLPVGTYTLLVDGTGSFTVEFCTASSTIDFSDEQLLTISPNPTSDYLQIESATFEAFEFEIHSQSGLLVQSGEIDSNQKIQLLELTKGVYFVRLKNGKGFAVRRFVVE